MARQTKRETAGTVPIYFRDLMAAKLHHKPLTATQLEWFINEYVARRLPDYQAAALLTAIWFNGLNDQELFALTKAMVASGKTITFHPEYKKPLVDKHSTGGIGDKVTLALAPLLACFELGVAKMSGRGLGFTGGTIDKLEAVGVKPQLTIDKAKQLLAANGLFIISQLPDLVPADQLLYALRDVTNTVDSLPLIAASVIAKKVALQTDYIFLDVKYGAGAFCKTLAIAKKFANMATKLARKFHRQVKCELTPMHQVLGRAVGNAIEVQEAADYLAGRTAADDDFAQLMERFSADILVTTKQYRNKEEAVKAIRGVIKNGAALNKMRTWINSQGGNGDAVVNRTCFAPKYAYAIVAPQAGTVHYPNVVALAELAVDLGAGRRVKDEPLDFQAGIWLNKKETEAVLKNAPVCTLYASEPIRPEWTSCAQNLFVIRPDKKPAQIKLGRQ